jgi:hypothetical protein
MNAIDLLNQEQSNAVSINIGLDFSPETFRQGYGEIESFELIERTGYNVLNFKDNRVSFIISDNSGYFLFFESRYFIPANKSTLNAVNIDPISIIRLKQHFFDLYKSEADYKNEIANSFVDETVKLNNIHQEYSNKPIIEKSPIDEKTFQEVSSDLQENPPLKPDYQRIVNYYSNKFQYARLEIVGANLRSKKIELPSKALPIKDAELKKQLEAKLNLFDKNSEAAFFEELESFNDYVAYIRSNYLTPLKCRKENILNRLEKVNFENAINNLKVDLKKVTSNKIMELATYIENTKSKLAADLADFFFQNKEVIFQKQSLFEIDNEYIKLEAKNLATEIISKIKWPKAIDLLEDFKINTYYSDITFEDLKNEELVKELINKGLINSSDINNLSQFGKSIEVK